MGSGGTHLLQFDGLRQTRKDGLQSLNQPRRVVLLFSSVVLGLELVPVLDITHGEGMNDMPPLRSQGWIQQRWNRHKDHSLLGFKVIPVLQEQVMTVEAIRYNISLHP